MKRTTSSLALVGLLLLGLAACGGSSGAGSSDGASTTITDRSGAAGSSDSAGGQDLGNVLALGEEFLLADLLSLGVTPIASTATVADAGFTGMDDFATEGIEILPNEAANFEQLAALDVDTVLAMEYVVDALGMEQLEALGEVIVVPTSSGTDQLTQLGELLGREDEAEQLVDELEAARTAAADTAADGCEVSVATIYGGPTPAAWIASPNNVAVALEDLGCTLAPSTEDQQPDMAGRVYLSLENLGLLSAPKLILLQSTAVDGEDAALAEVAGNPIWQRLPAVEADQVTTLDRLGYPGVAGLIRLYDELAQIVD